MNYTQNYHLPQWVKEDRIMMEDFNAAMASMESGMTATAADSAQAVSTANAAHAIAQQTAGAAYTPDNKPYVIGTYTGNGQEREIHVGFRPSVVIIFTYQTSNSSGVNVAVAGSSVSAGKVTVTDTGFHLNKEIDNLQYPNVNSANGTYQYIAFR